MRKLLVALALAVLAIAAGPPTMVQASPMTPQAAQAQTRTDVLAPIAATATRAAREASVTEAIDLMISDKSAGKKKPGEKDKVTSETGSAALPRYPLLL